LQSLTENQILQLEIEGERNKTKQTESINRKELENLRQAHHAKLNELQSEL